MDYSIKEMSDLAGVSNRTLRYYDEIGLLKPYRNPVTGYRVYREKEVDLLQQILFYRAMGIKLEKIQEIMTKSDFEIAKALRSHHQQLLLKRNQLDQLIITVEKTIAYEKGEIGMSNKEKFEGFKKEKLEGNERNHGKEIREKYGDETINASNKKYRDLTEEDYLKMQKTEEELFDALKEVLISKELDSDKAKEVYEKHKQWLKFSWPTYSKEAHKGLAQMYLEDSRFGDYYNKKVGNNGVEILVKIIEKYTNL